MSEIHKAFALKCAEVARLKSELRRARRAIRDAVKTNDDGWILDEGDIMKLRDALQPRKAKR